MKNWFILKTVKYKNDSSFLKVIQHKITFQMIYNMTYFDDIDLGPFLRFKKKPAILYLGEYIKLSKISGVALI